MRPLQRLRGAQKLFTQKLFTQIMFIQACLEHTDLVEVDGMGGMILVHLGQAEHLTPEVKDNVPSPKPCNVLDGKV